MVRECGFLAAGQRSRCPSRRWPAADPAADGAGRQGVHAGAEVLAFLQDSVREHGQTIVMVTHDSVAAAYADRVVFLADGVVTEDLTAPTTEAVLDTIKRLGAGVSR